MISPLPLLLSPRWIPARRDRRRTRAVLLVWLACLGVLTAQQRLQAQALPESGEGHAPPAATLPAGPPATATAPADESAGAHPPAPEILPAPLAGMDAINERLRLVETLLTQLAPPASQPGTQPSTQPEEEAARLIDQQKWELAGLLNTYREELVRWQQTLQALQAAPTPEKQQQIQADLDEWNQQREQLISKTEESNEANIAAVRERIDDWTQRLSELTTTQTANEQRRTNLPKEEADNEARIKSSLEELRQYLTQGPGVELSVLLSQTESEDRRADLLLPKRILEWRHNLTLLRESAYPDLTTHLQFRMDRTARRIATLQQNIEALRAHLTRLQQAQSRMDIAYARQQSENLDLPAWEREYWSLRREMAETVARVRELRTFTSFNVSAEGLFPQSESDSLTQMIERVRYQANRFMDGLDRRTGESLLNAYRQGQSFMTQNRQRISQMNARLDAAIDRLQRVQDATDEFGRLVYAAENLLTTTSAQASTEQLARIDACRRELREDSVRLRRDVLDPLQNTLQDTRDRLQKTLPAFEGFVDEMTLIRAKVYRRYLVVPGPSLLAPEWESLRDEWTALRRAHGEPVEQLQQRWRNIVADVLSLSSRQWFVAALLVIVTLWLGVRARIRLLHWENHRETALADVRDEAGELQPASPLRVPLSDRVQIQLARGLARTAVPGWTILALMFYLLTLHKGEFSTALLLRICMGTLMAIVHFALVTALFDKRRPTLRIIPCEDALAAYHRHWLRALGVLALILLPIPAVLAALDVLPVTRRMAWDAGMVVLLAALFGYVVRRRMFFLPVPEGQTRRWFIALGYRLYPILPVLVAIMLVAHLSGYAALVDYLLRGIGQSLLVVLVALAIRSILLGRLRQIAPTADPQASAPPPASRAVLRIVLQAVRLVVLVAALAAILQLWGISVVELRQIMSYPLIAGSEGRVVTPWRLIAGVLVVLIGWAGSNAVRSILRTDILPQATHLNRGTQEAILTLLHYTILALAIYIALQFAHIDLGALTILIGTLGLGLGLGLQPFFVNFISGLMMLIERKVKVGDIVQIGENTGEVTGITMRTTTIRNPDNIEFIIPNGEFINGQVTNWTMTNTRMRARIDVGVAYGTDTQLVKKLLLDIAHRHPVVLTDPVPEVWFMNFGADSLEFALVAWFSSPASRWQFLSTVRFEIDQSFRDHGINIPFPQRTLSLINDKPLPIELHRPSRSNPAREPSSSDAAPPA